MEDNAGRRIFPAEASEYQLLEEIGHGVSAIVYRAICKPFKEIVAVKCLDLERCNSNLENISHEAQLMSLIDHQSVIKAYCSFVVDHFLWVVMPYMDGGSCLHIMKVSYPDGFEEVLIATILKETLKALDYLHRQGHIHRDVKAGNILIDANGVVKLGDFGVSACMFNRGDRQRSRNTFVGTPCWMAPEVMEQKHGYDFRADIWSFGITALELAHGHAPFSKYPPIKVLLMTIQNAPPGLDHERDKRFSKAFKDMISMCLVKDPTKRPTAEKLLKHSFFKQAKSKEYISQHLLQNLSSLWEREKILMDKDAARLAEKKMPYLEQEEKSQNEYKRSVSAWNFNVEDLKVQAALIQDDDKAPSSKDGDEFQRTNLCSDDDSCGTSSLFTSPSPPPSIHIDPGRSHPLLITHSLKGDAVPIVCGDSVPCNQRVSSILVPPISLKSCGNGPGHRYSGKKESKQIGRFDVFEGDLELESPGWHECVLQKRFAEDQQRERQRSEGQGREIRTERNRDVRRAASGPLLPERVISPLKNACRSRTLEREMGSESSSDTFVELRGLGTHQKEHSHSGPTEAAPDQQCTNGCVGPLVRPIPGNKDAIEDKAKRPPFHRKGRFSITSTDTKTLEDAASSNAAQRPIKMQDTLFHKSASVGDCPSLSEQKLTGAVQLSSTSVFYSTDTSSVAVALLVPHLQNLLLQTATQQETICNMLKTISPADAMNGHCVSQLSFSPMKNGAGDESVANPPTDRERELLHQVSELQWKVTSLQSELQDIKLRNVQLERHLNAIYNRGEEERIRREEAAKGDS